MADHQPMPATLNPSNTSHVLPLCQDGRVVGAFMEGGSGEEAGALKALAGAQPALPAGGEAELGEQGVEFALAATVAKI